MKHLKLALLISAIPVFALACAKTDNTVSTNHTNIANTASTPVSAMPATDELAAARSTYNAACVKCHKENGEGGMVEFDEGGALKVPSFKSGKGLTQSDIQFARQIAKGGDGMPAFEKKLTPEQISGLVRFIRKEFQTAPLSEGAASPSH
jgi:mono/diheme cytochrome c family protein